MCIKNYSYTESHKEEGKGFSYDESYRLKRWNRFLWSREQKALRKILDKFYSDVEIDLLDFACGTGRVASFLEGFVRTSVGLDVSDSMLEQAQKKLTKTELINADIIIEDVLGHRKFNMITAFRFFLNADQASRENVLKVLASHLTDDGYLIFNNHQCSNSPWVKLRSGYFSRHRKCEAYNTMTIGQMINLVEAVGLEICKIYPVGFFHPPKIKIPLVVNIPIEEFFSSLRVLDRFSESPIAVCRWKG